MHRHFAHNGGLTDMSINFIVFFFSFLFILLSLSLLTIFCVNDGIFLLII